MFRENGFRNCVDVSAETLLGQHKKGSGIYASNDKPHHGMRHERLPR
jgi:hypothetical protein